MKKEWHCERQRAGKLVKECKALRPRLSKKDDFYTRAEKNKVLASPLRSSVRREPKDRVELMLALMGERATHYGLTYWEPFLPKDYEEARRRLDAFLRRLRRYHKGCFDYVYAIEGKHGNHRYHLHIVLRDDDFTPSEVAYLWGYGGMEAVPLLLDEKDVFWRTAKYFVKERTDGVVFPLDAKLWGCSTGLRGKLPKLEVWKAKSGKIWIPKGAVVREDVLVRNAFGQYHYVVYQKR